MSSFFKTKTLNNSEPAQDLNKLTGSELDFLLRILKTCSLRGDQVEQFYNTVIKLQNQYIDQQPK
jgi:hypothetical protein